MLRFYSIFKMQIILISLLIGHANLIAQTNIGLNDTSIVKLEKSNYPGKPLIMSLVLPGAGQYYNKAPLWKTLSFIGVEVSSLIAWKIFRDNASKLKDEYQDFADNEWSLSTWVYNRFNPTSIPNEDLSWTTFSALNTLTGTHHLNLIISGSLANELNLTKVSSDSLEEHPEWVLNPDWAESGDVQVVRDRHFYENIGKYDQFLGGWSDASLDWYWEEKDVGDSTEIIIKTPFKSNYIDKRYKSNQMLNLAKYSITVIMFNHVFSGIESVWYNQRKARVNKDISTDLSLTYSPYNSSGIGGVSLIFTF
tara:strand:+ start:993 stop:1916 length:924 start_codon:yes stop_codon:yes gene_type:complete